MKSIALVLSASDTRNAPETVASYPDRDLIEETILVVPSLPEAATETGSNVRYIAGPSITSGSTLNRVLETATADYLLIVLPGGKIEWSARAIRRLLQVAEDSDAGIVYCDYRDFRTGPEGQGVFDHPLVDYHSGSIRDSFDFGGAILVSRVKADRAIAERGAIEQSLNFGALYDLRLKLSEVSSVRRLPEYLYVRYPIDVRDSGERIFDYVNPQQRAFQIEMETVATAHLKRIGAHLSGEAFQPPEVIGTFPVEASVVIPVRNRAKTIEDAVRSALSQQTTLPFNVIVVDNHSTDGTTEKLASLLKSDARLVLLRPSRTDLGIGGCWNEALFSDACGRYIVQLDSDDLYSDSSTLERIVLELKSGPYAMVIGSYTIVDFDLNVLPPGLIDHREWTDDNGRNNALRINGLGAPRAFDSGILRKFGFPNVSYGEDYAVALRISRSYRIGRLYDSVYLARRWGGNSDSGLPLETMNRYDAYKDWVRGQEIAARIQLNRSPIAR